MQKLLALGFLFSSIVIVGAGAINRLPVLIAGPNAAPRSAAAIYAKSCASCHGRDGHGKTAKGKLNHARDLSEAQWQANVTDERIFNSINNGKGKRMPAFGKHLSDAEIDSLVPYVRDLKR
jgi:mono/diheme cytochrome c family protein